MSPKRRSDDKPFTKFVERWAFPLLAAVSSGATSWAVMDVRVAHLEGESQEMRQTIGTLRETVSRNAATIEAIIRGGSM